MYNNDRTIEKQLISTIICERQGEEVSTKLLEKFPSLEYILVNSTVEELLEIKGLGSKRIQQLKAVTELARRLYTLPANKIVEVKRPDDVANLMIPEMRFLKKEVFKIILLNIKCRVIDVVDVSVGSLNSSIVHPREVFVEAIKRSSASMVLVHNHPSGDTSPSEEDKNITRRLIEAGKILGIEVVDHIIVGGGSFMSFKEKGLI